MDYYLYLHLLYLQSHNYYPLFPVAKHHSVPNFIRKYTYPIGSKNNQTKI